MLQRKIGKHPALAAPYGEPVTLAAGLNMIANQTFDGPLVLDQAKLNRCNASRKTDREIIAGVLLIIAKRHGATVERRDTPANPGWSGQGIDLRFELNGVGAMIGIDNLHGGEHALISWHNTKYPSRNFTTRFCVAVGDLPSRRPHHKATSCPDNWYLLAMFLDGGLMLAARGEAFIPFDL